MNREFILAACLVLGLLAGLSSQARAAETEKKIERPVKEAIDVRQATQKKEEAWRGEKEKLLARFDQLEQERAQLRRRRDELAGAVESARSRVAAKEKQLADIEQISDQIEPFLAERIEALTSGLSVGPPFLPEERRCRVDRLKGLMADPDVPISEKYRKVMEALLVEAEYGFTIEVYQAPLPMEGQTLLANVFRLGRLSLFYLSLDGGRCGFYNVASRTWQALPPEHLPAVRAAVEIASKRRSAELLPMPLGRITTP